MIASLGDASTMSPTSTPRSQATRSREAGPEWARLAACVGIIWFHASAPGHLIAYGGLPLLTALSVMFAIRVRSGTTVGAVWRSRVTRLGVPWLFWSAVYAVLKSGQAIAAGEPIGTVFEPVMLLTGPALHLWWLPYALVVTGLAGTLAATGALRATAACWWVMGFALVLSPPLICWAMSHRPGTPLAQWSFTAPSVALGLVTGMIVAHAAGVRRAVLIGVASALFLVSCALSDWLIARALLIPYAAGVAVLMVTLAARAPAGPIVSWLGGLSFGVYLVHPALISLVERTGVIPPRSILLVGVVTVLSFVAAAVLKKTPLARLI